MKPTFFSKKPAPQGFTLILTISLMVLLTLIGIGMLSLSAVTLRSSSQASINRVARDNARLAMMIAIGQLQKHAGRDTRITSTADIAGDVGGTSLTVGKAPTNNVSVNTLNKGLSSLQHGTRFWTGVWSSNTTAAQSYSVTPTPVWQQWLISGNETATSAATSILPSSAIAAVNGTGEVGNPETAVVLVGKNSVGPADANTLPNYVAAPLVKITQKGILTGRYGWWVGDEGTKAKFNTKASTTPNVAVTYRDLVPTRRGWEAVTGYANYPLAGMAAQDNLDKVVDLNQAELFDPAFSAPLQRNFHAVTTDSLGVLADTVQGGLRLDLTPYINNGFPTSAQTTFLNAPTLTANILPTAVSSSIKGPKWSQLKYFADRFKNLADGKLLVRTASTSGSSASTDIIAPLILDFRLLFGAKPVVVGGGYRLNPCGKFAVTLANPYPYPLEWKAALDFEIFNDTPSGNRPSCIWGAAGQPAYIPRDLNEAAVFNKAIFRIAPGTIPAGEARAYTVNSRITRPLNSIAPVTVNLSDFSSSSPGNFDKCVELEHASVNGGGGLDVRESWQTTLVSLEMRSAGSSGANAVLRRCEKFDLDNGFYSQVVRGMNPTIAATMTRPFPLHSYSFQISHPGADYASYLPGGMGLRSSTVRTFTDFNLQCTRFTKNISSYNPPPYFMESSDSLGQLPFNPPGGETGIGFTRNLAVSPVSWGREQAGGSKKCYLFDIPDNLVSLAQLQHADLTADELNLSIGNQPGNAVGNSYATTFVKRALSKQTRYDYIITGSPNPSEATGTARTYFDMSFLLNNALWDSYFLSSIPTSVSTALESKHFVKIYPGDESSSLRDAAKASSRLFINGAFNINCTSKDAWKAFFASTKRLKHKADVAATTEAMFPRGLSQKVTAKNPPTGTSDDSFGGFRRLNDTQIDALAEQMVRQVRERGPFVSLSHFVNRALVDIAKDSKKLAGKGALQTAIDNAGLNIDTKGLKKVFSGISVTEDKVVMQADGNAPAADLVGGDVTVLQNAYGDTDPAWAPKSRDDNPGAMASIIADRQMLTDAAYREEQGFRSTGIPGWLTQADVLQVLGPLISARSDTFKIRAYGEALSPDTGKVAARAYCEAIVQRMPVYVDPKNAETVRDAALTPLNKYFGRRFNIISFRWLNANEI